MPPTLSLCLMVKNEELLIGGALDGWRDYADECVVVDTGSTDRTIEVAERAGAIVVQEPWDESNHGRTRNVYVERATSEWILVLDGDECIAPADRPQLRQLLDRDGINGWRFTVRNYCQALDLLSNWHRNIGDYPDEERRSACPGRSEFDVVRLFRRLPGVRYSEKASSHVNPIRSLNALGGRIEHAPVVIHHFQWLKGGAAFVLGKQHTRLAGELDRADHCPDDGLANMNAGRTLFALGRDDAALGYLSRAIRADEESPQAHFLRGLVLFQAGRHAEAAHDLRAAIALNQTFGDAWVVLGMLQHDMGELEDAETALLRALACHPHHPLAHNSLGVVYMDAGRIADSEAQLKRALEILPDLATAAWNLASLYEQTGALDEARRVCVAALDRSPNDESLRQKLSALGS